MKENIICPGCGLTVFSDNHEFEKDLDASSACRELYHKLSYYTLSLHDSYFIHQLLVDAYAAQHYGENVKPITITFALIGLFLVNEKKYTGKQVQLIHLKLAHANKKNLWPTVALPTIKAVMTVQDILDASDEKKQEVIKKWNKSVWNIWKPEEEKICQVFDLL